MNQGVTLFYLIDDKNFCRKFVHSICLIIFVWKVYKCLNLRDEYSKSHNAIICEYLYPDYFYVA
jgi:hypothetical protein